MSKTIVRPKVRNRFDRIRVSFSSDEPTRTKQSFAKECDINVIMGKYAKGQVVDHLAKHGGRFGEVPAMDFQEAMNIVAKGQEMFDDLPADLRKRFGNDPGAFLLFAQDESNLDELRKLKLAKPAAKAEPSALEARVAQLELDSAAKLEIARRALKAPPHTAS